MCSPPLCLSLRGKYSHIGPQPGKAGKKVGGIRRDLDEVASIAEQPSLEMTNTENSENYILHLLGEMRSSSTGGSARSMLWTLEKALGSPLALRRLWQRDGYKKLVKDISS